MKFIPPAINLALYCACILPVTGKLRGNGKVSGNGKGKGPSNPQDDQPSPVLTEDGDYHASPDEDCTLLAIDHLMIPGEEGHNIGHGRALEGDASGLEWACTFADGTVADMSGLDDSQRSDLEDAMNKGQIVSGSARLDLGRIPGASRKGSSVTLPPGFKVKQNARASGKGKGQGGGSGRAASGRRNLAQLVGNKYTLVVKGKFIDYPFDSKTPWQISDDVFGTLNDAVNMASQLEACSFGKLVTKPEPDPAWGNGAFTSLEGIESAPGVLEIDMGVNMAGMSKSDIWNLFVEKTMLALDPTGAVITSLPGPFDHIMFSREVCLPNASDSCTWAAYASVNSWGQMYKGNYISYPGVQVHEMGHALNLAHSGSNGISWSGGYVSVGGYTDHTGMMGNPLFSDEVGNMCFNPAKNFQIDGWYNDAKITLDPMDATWEGNMVGVGEYDLRGDKPVTIKIETGTPQDIFVGFNRAAGPNLQNDLADNLVNVIQVEGNDGVGYSQSRLIGLLDTSASYSELSVPGIVDYADLKIKVNSINAGTLPGTANLKIGFDQCTSDLHCQDLAGGCFTSSCLPQFTAGTNVLGCLNIPILLCCGNDICEGGESSTNCAADCTAGPNTIQPDDCQSCWARDGAMFDVEAKPDADLSITSIEYKAYTASGNVRVYYRVGGKTGYASGTNLLSNGWVYAKQAAACGAWDYCAISGLSINVPRGNKVGLLVAYDNGGDILYYSNNFGIVEDDYAMVHPGAAVNFNLAGEYAYSFHNSLMFSGKVTYTADLTTQCTSDGDCDDGSFCNGQETCNLGTCESGTAPTCTAPNDTCSDALGACVSCLSEVDCADGNLCNGIETCNASGQCVAGTAVTCGDTIACTVDFCTPSTGLCTSSPNHLLCDDGEYCNGAETCDTVNGCQDASPIICSSPMPFCSEPLDQCVKCLSNSDCDDGDMCNGGETCNVSGQCIGGTPIDCNPTETPTKSPVTPQPTTPAPTSDLTPNPVTPAPTNGLTTLAPATNGPTTLAPATNGPTTLAPATNGPTTLAPVTPPPTPTPTPAPTNGEPAPTTSAPTPAVAAVDYSLETNPYCSSTGGARGIWFDVVAKNTLTVTSLAFETSYPGVSDVLVYTKTGTHVGSEQDASAWTLLADVPQVTLLHRRPGGAWPPISTHLPESLFNQVILANERRAFYIHIPSSYLTYGQNFVNGNNAVGALQKEDANIQQFVGSTECGGGLFGCMNTIKLFNGFIHYTTGEMTPTPTPAPIPTDPPAPGPTTAYPTPSPSYSLSSYYPTVVPNNEPTRAPITPPAPTEPTTITASYDISLGAPKCINVGGACTSGALLNSRATIYRASEPNKPNTIDTCTDGTYGSYHNDESIDMVTVKAAYGGNLVANGAAIVEAKVWAWSTGSSDWADFYYNSGDVNTPVWEVIAENVRAGGGGERTISSPIFILPGGLVQSVRVNFRYGGSPKPCSTGSYDDTDDLVFNVAAVTPGSDGAALVTASGAMKPGPIKYRPSEPTPAIECESIGNKQEDKERCADASCVWKNGKNKGCYSM